MELLNILIMPQPTHTNLIAIEKITNDDIKSAVFLAFQKINAQNLFTREGMVVFIKPNVLIAKTPERAATTHPEILRAVIQWVKQFKPQKILVGDSCGGTSIGVTEKALKVTGIQDVCDSENAICKSLEKTERTIYQVENHLVISEFPSTSWIQEADLIINLPVIKTHGQCIVTCCIKNMFGTIILGNKPKTHAQFPSYEKFCSALVDIYSVSKPHLTLIDGYLCQEGKGPSAGDVVKLDILLAGYDPVALDTTVCKIIDVDSSKVLYLSKAEKQGLGTTDLSKIIYTGESIQSVFHPFKMPASGNLIRPLMAIPLPKKLTQYLGSTLFRANIEFDKSKCKLCSTCWKNCPVTAIDPPAQLKPGNIPIWNKKKCITCYCCAELCPYEAVEFKVNIVKNLFTSGLGIGIIGFILLLSWGILELLI